LSDSSARKEAASDETPPVESPGRLSALLHWMPWMKRLRGWASGHWTRRVGVAVAILALIAGTVAAWAFLARVALHSGQIPIEVALDALDQGQIEQARALASRMLTSGLLPKSEYGGPLFILGSIKTYDAELDPSPDKKRIDYLVASRYLKEASAYGFPAGREAAGLYLLGKSLLESNQFEEGLSLFETMLSNEASEMGPLAWSIHRLLASACLWMPRPDLDKALAHGEVALENPNLKPEERAGVLIDRSECLARLGRFDDARRALDSLPADANRRAYELLTRAAIIITELEASLQSAAAQDSGEVVAKVAPRLDEALRGLEEAATASDDSGGIALRAAYLRAKASSLRGDLETALSGFTRIRQFHADTPEGIAAALNEAELFRQRGEFAEALLGYRRVLEAVNPNSHRSYLVSLDRIRKSAVDALSDFVEHNHFEEARALLARFVPLFSRIDELTFRSAMLKRWGESLLREPNDDAWTDNPQRVQGRRLLREAGTAYELLAQLRFASEAYTNDLWEAAENYYRGHSFSRAAKVLNEFLAHEPQLRNAQALLLLGQSHLALGQIPQSISAFEECIEFYPQDSATYQVRIDCAKAHRYNGNADEAEKLLRHNIAFSKLKPASREWKDSLFELGMLLYDKGQYEQAIDTLSHAIERYPNDQQTLLAQYVVGVSYRNWAEEEQQREQVARTTTEREKNAQHIQQRLNIALEHFIAVQRNITLGAEDESRDPMKGAMLRNCYMLAGTVLFDLGRYNDAINAFSNVSSLYPNDPFVLETFVQIANCWHRLKQVDKARGAIEQARIAFDRLPPDADFTGTSALSRDEWRLLLGNMERW
jgi:tetratricopeptide (TPR) repeat protein